MKSKLDWSVPILPGISMMGLTLGVSRQEVLDALHSHKVENGDIHGSIVVQFPNSPKLVLEESPDAIILRDPVSWAPDSPTLDELFVMGFKDDVLVHLMTSLVYGASLEYYKGRIFNEVGFGTPVSELAKHCEIEFDSGDELFYFNDRQCMGLSIGGSCSSLEDDPDQTVSYIRVYAPKE
ncbi:hypothetical protein KIV45_21005 [Janthinobacterium lividum]|nr:hypothetical protein KIV45_21005 [Janthinobacterium lividum]